MGRESRYDNHLELTPREREVRELLRLGLTDAEIAERLGISKSAVGHHVSAIISKLGVSNRYEAAYWPERPPWWMAGLAPGTFFWRKASALLQVKASSVALTLSGGAFVVALSSLGLVLVLFLRVNGDVASTRSEHEALAALPVEAEPARARLALPSSREPPPTATPSSEDDGEPLKVAPVASPVVQALPVVEASVSGADPAGTVQSTPKPTQTSPPPNSSASGPPPRSPTATPTPAWTSTPRSPRAGVMAVDCNAGLAGVQRACRYEPGREFRIQVHVTQAPAGGYYAFEVRIQWLDDHLDYLRAADLADELLWPRCDLPVQHPMGPALLHYGCFQNALDTSEDTGALLEFQFLCQADGATPMAFLLDLMQPKQGTHFKGARLRPLETITNDAQVTCGSGTGA